MKAEETGKLTYFKMIQLFSAAFAVLVGFTVDLFDYDSSFLFYIFFLINAAYAAYVFIKYGIVHFLKRNRLLVLIMVMLLAGIIIHPKYSRIYSYIRLMEVFIFLMCSMLYTGKEDMDLIRKSMQSIFRIIVLITFCFTVGSFLFGIFGSTFINHGMTSFLANNAEMILKWHSDLKQYTLGGLYHNSNQLGLNAFCSAILSLYFISLDRHSYFDWTNLLIQCCGIVFSGCRSIMIACAVVLFSYAFLCGSRNIRRLSLLFILVVFAGLTAVTMIKMNLNNRTAADSFANLMDRLTGSRYSIWAECWTLIKSRPLFGVGLGNIRNAAREIEDSFIIRCNYNNAHNIILNIAASTGVVGSFMFILLGRDCYHGLKRVSPILLVFCLGMLTADCFDIFLVFTDKLPTFLFPAVSGYGYQLMLREKKPFYFFSNLVEENIYKELYTKQERPGQQSQKFNRLIAEGFELNHRKVVCCTSVLASDSIVDYRIKKLKNHGMYHYSLSINIPGVKNIWNLIGAFFYTLFAEYGACAVDVLSIDNAIGALAAAGLRGMPTAGIVTDLPEHFSGDGMYAKLVYKIMDWCGSYVFLTEYMNEKLNPKHKPYIVMEGLCDASVMPLKVSERENSIIFAGEIDEQNGVITFAKAFNEWGNHGYELYYYGSGEAMELLKKETELNSHVHLMGVIMNRELLKIMEKASLLVNPRPIHQDFVKYSFPSKVMEYMNTGTYHASTRLACIPDEYFDYIGDLGDGSPQDILKFLKSFEKMTPEYMEEKAQKAQEFVLTYKNNKVQAGRIAALLDGMYEQIGE